jgi:hypothetical protein
MIAEVCLGSSTEVLAVAREALLHLSKPTVQRMK